MWTNLPTGHQQYPSNYHNDYAMDRSAQVRRMVNPANYSSHRGSRLSQSQNYSNN